MEVPNVQEQSPLALDGNGKATVTLSVDRLLQTVGGLLLMVCMGLQVWMLKTMVDYGNRLTAIESSRFTSDDALELTKAITQLQSREPEMPPWFVNQVQANTDTLDEVKKSVQTLERTSPEDVLAELKEIRTDLTKIKQP